MEGSHFHVHGWDEPQNPWIRVASDCPIQQATCNKDPSNKLKMPSLKFCNVTDVKV